MVLLGIRRHFEWQERTFEEHFGYHWGGVSWVWTRAAGQTVDENCDEKVASSGWDSSADDHFPSTLSSPGPEVQDGATVWRTSWRSVCYGYQKLRPWGGVDDVHLKNGAHIRQGPLLRIWTCFLWKSCDWIESEDYGTKLQAWIQNRSLP